MKGRTIVAGLLLIFATVLFFFFKGKPPTARLPDGTWLTLSGVAFGKNNVFKHGSMLEKMAGNIIPTNGLHFLSQEFQRPMAFTWPDPTPHLTLEFRLDGPSNLVEQSTFMRPNRKRRILTWGDDPFPYCEEIGVFQPVSDGWFSLMDTSTFSRTSRNLHVQFQERDTKDGAWRAIANFAVKNPARSIMKQWPIETYPIAKTKGPLTVRLGEVVVKTNANPWHNIWPHAVELPFHFLFNGQIGTNWAVHDMDLTDSTGNHMAFGASKSVSNGIVWYNGSQALDPTASWRLKTHVTRDSGFDASNVFTVKIPYPLSGPIHTNLANLPIFIEVAGGVEYLEVKIMTNAPSSRLLFLHAENESGETIHKFSGSWSQQRFWKSIDLRRVRSSMSVTFAIEQDFVFEFNFKPRLMEKFTKGD